MNVVHNIQEVRAYIKAWRKEGLSIGFVPTMGYLHEGHQSLIEKAVSENDKVVVSIFINPMQFGPKEDLASYPRDLEQDCLLCEKIGTTLVFNPEPEEMYTGDFCSFVDMLGLTEGLCGKSRPTHFRGVCTVVTKLFNIVQPDRAYFGQKDAQQLAVIKQMVEDLNIDVQIIGCPIVRETDGLAKSSRNTYLSEVERKATLVLSHSLKEGRLLLESGETSVEKIVGQIVRGIEQEPLARLDYVEIVDAKTLQGVERVERSVLVAIAVYIGNTRLIDNFTFEC